MKKKKKVPPGKVIHVRISEELQAWIEKRTAKLGKKESTFIREVLQTLSDWEGKPQ